MEQIASADVLHRVKLDLLEPHHLAIQAHIAMRRLRARHLYGRRLELLQLLDLRVVDGIGEIIGIDAAHVRLAAFVIEALHLILPRLVQVDRLFVQRGQRRREGDFRDHLVIAGDIHHHEIVARDRAQADRVGGIGVRSPVPVAARVMQKLQIFQETGKGRR